MNSPQTDTRRFVSPCVIPSSADLPGNRRKPVSIPSTAAPTDTQELQLVRTDGIVREIVLKCPCDQEHRITLSYERTHINQENANASI